MSVAFSEINHQQAVEDVCELPTSTEADCAERLRSELEDTAYREWSRQRRRLGPLTPEQERALETLLLSVTNKISQLLIKQMRQSIEAKRSRADDIITLEEMIGS